MLVKPIHNKELSEYVFGHADIQINN